MMLLTVQGLKKYFPVKKGFLSRQAGVVKAVDDISFSIAENEVLGLVGESGCGKTTAGRCVLRLIEPTAGAVRFKDQDILPLKGASLKAMRRQMQIIFQDPLSSLNPRMTVGAIVAEPFIIHKVSKGADLSDQVVQLLDRVGLPKSAVNRYPHEFSGGQRQRIGIARAIALRPALIIADEPVSALDVSVQAQIINLLDDLKRDFGLSYLFIAHNLSVVKHISNRIAVMYLGRIVESGPSDQVCDAPLHPYTKALIAAVPEPRVAKTKKAIVLQGDVPSPMNPPSGCAFHPRCSLAKPDCREKRPELVDKREGRAVACPYA
ncbi:MAG: peptide ABC transporter substrate-binding protein [Elusimicrobia bacterium RIFOXYB2_FULL_49_7]|nr:MAG: peptide ABC transporter substrate-binding protein [Elusimicrobia bacterium RIFOXYB2_FULL_49_7]